MKINTRNKDCCNAANNRLKMWQVPYLNRYLKVKKRKTKEKDNIFNLSVFVVLMILAIQPLKMNAQIVIQDSVFTTTLDMNGSKWNNALIKNCTFKDIVLSDGIRIADADSITIDSCYFYNIQGNGIRLHPSGGSNGIQISNCVFDSIYGNGILAAEQHRNTKILNNRFNWIGLDTVSSENGAPHHGIYFTGYNYLIEGNRISNIYNAKGNCISVRSNGIVRNNVVWGATKNGIDYYSDHPAVGSLLLIENNIVYDCARGIKIQDGGESYVDTSIIRFNTVIIANNMCVGIGPSLSMDIDIYANILVREDGNQYKIWAESPFDSAKNVLSNGDIGFVDFNNNDFHIIPGCIADSYATGLTDFPTVDFEGDIRTVSDLDAGADQIDSSTTGFYDNKPINKPIRIYPNPTSGHILLRSISQDYQFKIKLFTVTGQIIIEVKNQTMIDVSNVPDGVYFLSIEMNDLKEIHKIIKI